MSSVFRQQLKSVFNFTKKNAEKEGNQASHKHEKTHSMIILDFLGGQVNLSTPAETTKPPSSPQSSITIDLQEIITQKVEEEAAQLQNNRKGHWFKLTFKIHDLLITINKVIYKLNIGAFFSFEPTKAKEDLSILNNRVHSLDKTIQKHRDSVLTGCDTIRDTLYEASQRKATIPFQLIREETKDSLNTIKSAKSLTSQVVSTFDCYENNISQEIDSVRQVISIISKLETLKQLLQSLLYIDSDQFNQDRPFF